MQGHSVLAIPFVVFSLKIIAMKKRILALAIISSVCWCSTATAQHKGNSTSNSGREAVTPRTDFEREPTRRGESNRRGTNDAQPRQGSGRNATNATATGSGDASSARRRRDTSRRAAAPPAQTITPAANSMDTLKK